MAVADAVFAYLVLQFVRQARSEVGFGQIPIRIQ
jgi:hypothetical protein